MLHRLPPQHLTLQALRAIGEAIRLLVQPLIAQRHHQLPIGPYRFPELREPRLLVLGAATMIDGTPCSRSSPSIFTAVQSTTARFTPLHRTSAIDAQPETSSPRSRRPTPSRCRRRRRRDPRQAAPPRSPAASAAAAPILLHQRPATERGLAEPCSLQMRAIRFPTASRTLLRFAPVSRALCRIAPSSPAPSSTADSIRASRRYAPSIRAKLRIAPSRKAPRSRARSSVPLRAARPPDAPR